jgi:hypothetical protein
VSAILARPPRTTRLARTLGLDGNPLRRATGRAQAADRYSARAVLLEPALPQVTMAAARGGDQARALVRRQCPGAAPRTGELLAASGSRWCR